MWITEKKFFTEQTKMFLPGNSKKIHTPTNLFHNIIHTPTISCKKSDPNPIPSPNNISVDLIPKIATSSNNISVKVCVVFN